MIQVCRWSTGTICGRSTSQKPLNGIRSAAAFLSVSSPRFRRKQQKHGEQLQTTGEHIESQHDFTQRVQRTEVGCRTDLIESRTDVIDAGNNRGEAGYHILTVQTDNKDGNGNDDQICHKKGVVSGLLVV